MWRGAGSGYATQADPTLAIVTSGKPYATDLTVRVSRQQGVAS
ncbi:MAG: hypothetical protein ABSE50_08770 [Xanthobacteraceae bacterium]